MLARLRKVHTARDTIREVLGEPKHPTTQIFPLSPSAISYGLQGGCSLPRYLGSVYGWKTKMRDYVLRGGILDDMLGKLLTANLAGTEVKEEAIIESGLTYFDKEKHRFEAVQEGWIDAVIGDGICLIRAKRDTMPESVQAAAALYIGASSTPIPADRPKGNPDWIWGYSDWTEKAGRGSVTIHDLKVTSKPSIKSAGRYRFQLYTYATARYQSGSDVRGIRLEQFDTKKKQFLVVPEDYTRLDYDRVIQIGRQARDHYLGVLEGRNDFLIPYRGIGKCSQYSCDFYMGCPLGANQKSAREEYVHV